MSQTDDGVEEIPSDGEDAEEEEKDSQQWSIYDSDTFISGEYQSDHCTIPEGILQFQYPFIILSARTI